MLLLLWLFPFLTPLGHPTLERLDPVQWLQVLTKAYKPLPLKQPSVACPGATTFYFSAQAGDFTLWSDDRPHQGAFEGVSGQMSPEETSFKSELLFQQLASIQDPAANPQVSFKTSPRGSHDSGSKLLFCYADKNQIKSEPHGPCLPSLPRGDN